MRRRPRPLRFKPSDDGLDEEEDWLIDEMPPERRALEDDWSRRADQLQADAIRRAGGERFANLLENEPDEFEGQSAVGHATFWARWPDRGDASGHLL